MSTPGDLPPELPSLEELRRGSDTLVSQAEARHRVVLLIAAAEGFGGALGLALIRGIVKIASSHGGPLASELAGEGLDAVERLVRKSREATPT